MNSIYLEGIVKVFELPKTYKEEPAYLKAQSINDVAIFEIIAKIKTYYERIFYYIEKDPIPNTVSQYKEEKEKILNGLENFPLRFPIIKSLIIDNKLFHLINFEFDNYVEKIKQHNSSFAISQTIIPSFFEIYTKIYTPPLIGCLIGLLIGLSGMRNILFSSNHYLKTIFDAISIVTTANVPFIFATVGYSLASTKNLDSNLILHKKEIWIGLIMRYIIIPGIGLLYIYILVNNFEGIWNESIV
jgi:hypothetical protein